MGDAHMADPGSITVQFKFKVGDVVSHKVAHSIFISRGRNFEGGKEVFAWARDNRVVGIVLSRLVDQCSGGVQVSYRVRFVQPNGTPLLNPPGWYDLHEHELELYDDTQLKLKLEEVSKDA